VKGRRIKMDNVMKNKNVVVVGASPKENRYSNMAVKLLKEHNYNPIPIHPIAEKIHDIKCYHSLDDVNDEIDTVTLYLSEKNLKPIVDKIINLKPRRVVFNPGTESDEIEKKFQNAGIKTIKACTLVMLRTGIFHQN
jgi:predicted CoA-binding protein